MSSLLPRRIDNEYHGQPLGRWLLAVVVCMKSAMALNSIFNGRFVATSADGIPLEIFTPAGAQTVLALFAIWGLAQLVICAPGVLAVVRYRAMIPLVYVLLLGEHLGRKVVLWFLPIVRIGGPPGAMVNHVLLALLFVGLSLALWHPRGGLGETSPTSRTRA